MKTSVVFVHNLCLTEPTKDVWPGFLLKVFTLLDFPGVSKRVTVFWSTADSQKPGEIQKFSQESKNNNNKKISLQLGTNPAHPGLKNVGFRKGTDM